MRNSLRKALTPFIPLWRRSLAINHGCQLYPACTKRLYYLPVITGNGQMLPEQLTPDDVYGFVVHPLGVSLRSILCAVKTA